MKNQLNWVKTSAAVVLCAAAVSLTSNVTAANRIFELHLVNGLNQTVSFYINNTGHNCYEGSPGIGSMLGPVSPGKRETIRIARVQGHGCDGHQGEFEIKPSAVGGSAQHFDFDNEGHMQLSNRPAGYNGVLSAKNNDGSYTWTVNPE